MSSFHLNLAENALDLFKELSGRDLMLYHALLVSPRSDPNRFAIGDLNAIGEFHDSDKAQCPQEQAFSIIDRSLFEPFKGDDGFKMPPVIARNNVFLCDVLTAGLNTGRSVFASAQPDLPNPALEKLNYASRLAYLATRTLLADSPWDRIRDTVDEDHSGRSDHAHLWLSGLEFWAVSKARGVVACRRNFVRQSGKTDYKRESVGYGPPYRFFGTTTEKKSERPRVGFGNCWIDIPDDPQVARQFLDVIEGSFWFRIETDCCDASIMALHWVLDEAKKAPVVPSDGSDGLSNNGAIDSEATHSEDFSSVNWFGIRYRFSKGNQAQAIRVLWEAWKQGTHGLSQETIGEKIESSAERFEIRKTFRRKNPDTGKREQHPAWGTMIQPEGKGCYRLVPPKSDRSTDNPRMTLISYPL